MTMDRRVTFSRSVRRLPMVLGALLLLALGALPLLAAPSEWGGVAIGPGSEASVSATLRVTNLVPAFLRFHEAVARADSLAHPEDLAHLEDEVETVDPGDVLLASWQEYALEVSRSVGVALPGHEGSEPDLSLLEGAWERYASVMDRIREVGDGVTPAPDAVLRQVSELLRLDRPLEVHFVVYVGIFEDPPAFRLSDGEYTVLIPAELFAAPRRPALIDLFTRAVHARMAGRPPPGANLSVAEHLVVRGLALRVHEELVPGRPAEEYLVRSQAWLLDAERRDAAILNRFRPILLARETEALAAVGVGDEAVGAQGDFDYMAWRVGGLFLTHGWDLDRIAHEPLANLDPLVVELLNP
jgi:hypothetical protein